ncbi:MAG: molybdopterin converting factor subunit 1 [Flavicella sp.]
MQLNVLFFGIVADLLGTDTIKMDFSGKNVFDFKEQLVKNHPVLVSYKNYAVAVNEHYASDETPLSQGDTIAIIPPVSGG